VTSWSPNVVVVDEVFKALADETRRSLLDELFREDGQTLSALEERFAMTRFGVMKHLKLLEEAGLVVTRRRGREKLHFLNPVPIRLVHDRWVSKYAEPWTAALSDLKTQLARLSRFRVCGTPRCRAVAGVMVGQVGCRLPIVGRGFGVAA